MEQRIILAIVAALVCLSAAAQDEPARPRIVTPRPIITPSVPAEPVARPVQSQQKVIVAPVATLDAAAIRAIALQSAPPAGATRDERAALMRVSERLRHKDRQAAETEWAFLVERAARRDDKHKDWIHIESWSHYVLGQAYLEPNEDLKHRAEKVRFYHAQNLAALERRAELDDAKRQLDRSAPSTQTVTVRRLTMSDSFQPGRSAVTFGETEPVTVESVADELQSAVVLCKLTEEQEQMANIDLQNALQKQQQTMQTMSNVSKMLHDTAMAVIRKIGG